MTFFEDFRAAISSYDGDSVEVEIRAFHLYGAGSVLNTGEWFRFQIAVFNQGHIDMRNVTVLPLCGKNVLNTSDDRSHAVLSYLVFFLRCMYI